jgi:hypothetical protein
MVSRAGRRSLLHGGLALVLAIGAGIACDKVPLTAPTESTIVLFTNTTSIPVNGTAEITATVTESAGTPVQNGTVVTFFTSLGTIEPAEARTQNGKATVRLHAGTVSGTATVRATSGGNATTDPQLAIAVGGAAATRVELFATPASLPSGGGNVSLVAAVYDAGGNRLPGVPVSFVTDNGSLSTNSSLTDNNGEARSTLNTPVAASVVATVAGGASTLTATAKITLRSAPDVSVTIGTTSPVEDVPVSFVFTVKAGTSGAAVRSATVDFGDGSTQALATNGTTTASHTYRSAGTFTVTATAVDAAGEVTIATATVVVTQAVPLNVTLTASGTSHLVAIAFQTSVLPSGVAIDRYEWTFGDGHPVVTTSGGGTTHAYSLSGHYVVSVRVVATDGRTGTARIEIILS